jgi:hypothetical protein
MKNIILYIQNIFVKKYNKPPVLGRWSIENCHNRINNKIDLANEDHCGPCGKYINKKFVSQTIKEKK